MTLVTIEITTNDLANQLEHWGYDEEFIKKACKMAETGDFKSSFVKSVEYDYIEKEICDFIDEYAWHCELEVE